MATYLVQLHVGVILEHIECNNPLQAKHLAKKLQQKYELPHLHCKEINIYKQTETSNDSKVFEVQTNLILGKD